MSYIPDEYSLLVYFCGVSAVAIILYFWLNNRIALFKEKRVKRAKRIVKDTERVFPVPTDVLSDQEEIDKKKFIVSGVKARFTIIQRALFFLICTLWLVALTVPFVGKMPSTILSIIIAVTTAVVGVAVKPLVENMISGIVISFSNQLRVGDTLMIDKEYGTVEDISITHTKIKTWDWKRYVIPNSKMLSKEFANLTLNDSLLWAHVEFSVAYDVDLAKVKEAATTIAIESEYCTRDEDPQFWVMRMEKDRVVCWIAAWANSPADAWNLKSDISEKLVEMIQKEEFLTHKMSISMLHNGNMQ